MGTCGDDYSSTENLGYLLLGTATTSSTIPTTTEGCNAIKLAQTFIDGYLNNETAYSTVPAAIVGICTRVAAKIIQVMKWWSITEGATSDSDYQGSANYPPDLVNEVMTADIRADLDAWKAKEDYVLSSEVGLVIRTPQDSDLDFSKTDYA